jgi:hypothetical protein
MSTLSPICPEAEATLNLEIERPASSAQANTDTQSKPSISDADEKKPSAQAPRRNINRSQAVWGLAR